MKLGSFRLSEVGFILIHMALQLVLIDDSDRDWRISEQTKLVGRDGIAAARAALRDAARSRVVELHDSAGHSTVPSAQGDSVAA
jgi:hypothetical protein